LDVAVLMGEERYYEAEYRIEVKPEREPWNWRRHGKGFDWEWDKCLGRGKGRTPNDRIFFHLESKVALGHVRHYVEGQ